MGNYRFRLSDMIPNAWFYKLRDMSKTRTHNTSHPIKKKLPSTTTTSQKPHLSQPRQSYYYNTTTEPTRAEKFYNSPTNPKASDTHFPDSPRKSSKKTSKRKTIYKPSPRLVTSSVSTDCSSPETDFHYSPLSEFESDASDSFNKLASWSSSCSCRVSSSTTDIIIDMDEKSYTAKTEKLEGFDTISELELPPILTKPAKLEEREAYGSLSIKIVKEAKTSPLIRKSTGVKIRGNPPRIASKKIRRSASSSLSSKSQRKSFSMSFAIVKSSFDPQKDFQDSMVEMIVENNIRASKDLEELLACYLSLNSDEYHDLIVKAFEQIWFDMADLGM
uniref:Transcription repressor n=1 Tax=Davidia involucrata TaxID=16924 RepID=A0A5B7BGZ9_DAVIN